MNSLVNICRLCLQKCLGPPKILNNDPKTSSMVEQLFPDMGIGLVKSYNICEDCFKNIQFSYTMSQTIIKNEEKLNYNKALVDTIQDNICRLCWTIDMSKTPVFLYEIPGQMVPHLEAQAIIKVSLINLDFDVLKKPVVCSACWNIVISIYLFKKKCLTINKIFNFYCTKNSVTSLTNDDVEAVSRCYNATLQKVSESHQHDLHNLKNSPTSRENECDQPEEILDSKEGIPQSDEMCSINFDHNEVDDKFEEEYHHISQLPLTIKEEPIEKSLSEEKENIEVNHLGGDFIQDNNCEEFVEECPITKENTFENEEKFVETSHSSLENIETCTIPTTVLELEIKKNVENKKKSLEKNTSEKNNLPYTINSSKEVTNQKVEKLEYMKNKRKQIETLKTTKQTNRKLKGKANSLRRDQNNIKKQSEVENCEKILQPVKKQLKNSSGNIGQSSEHVNPDIYNGVKEQKSKENIREKKWSCSKCEFKTKYKNHLNRHSLQHVNHVEIFDCTECLYSTPYKRNLDRHILNHSYDSLIDQNVYGIKDKNIKKADETETFAKPATFKCPECPYSSGFEVQFLAHMKTHKSKNILKCSKCYYITLRKNCLVQHMELHNKGSVEKKFKCTKCSFKCSRPSYLSFHMSTHEKIPKFKCNECSYSAKKKSHLVTHVIRHQKGDKKVMFQCPYCPRKSMRREHMRLHCRTQHDDMEQIDYSEIKKVTVDC